MIAPYTNLDDDAVKTQTHSLVSAVGGAASAAGIMRRLNDKGELVKLSSGRVSGYCTIADMGRFISVPNMLRLEIAAGRPVLSEWIAGRLTRDGSAPVAPLCHESGYRLRRALRDLEAEVDDALADSSVTSAERAAIRADIDQVERELAILKAKVERP